MFIVKFLVLIFFEIVFCIRTKFMVMCLCAPFSSVVAYKNVEVFPCLIYALEEEHNMVVETVVVENIGPLEDVL